MIRTIKAPLIFLPRLAFLNLILSAMPRGSNRKLINTTY